MRMTPKGLRVEPRLTGTRLVEPPMRRDPAPSRVVYRLHRMWLTPLYRSLLRRGLPVFVLITGLAIWAHDPARRDKVAAWVDHVQQAIAQRPEFMVGMVAIDGASQGLSDAIRAKLDLTLPISSFDLDLDGLQAKVAELDAVQSSSLRVRRGGVLEVQVTERKPVVVWRRTEGIGTLDATGHAVEPLLSRLERPDLPLIVGEGADKVVPEALDLIAAAEPIRAELRGLVRVGERRWDVVIEPDRRLMLPEDNPVQALERIVALDQASQLLERDVTAVDLRNPLRPTLRLSPDAAETFHETSALLTGAKTP